MSTSGDVNGFRRNSRLGIRGLTVAAGSAYLVVAGTTAAADLAPPLTLVNLTMATGLAVVAVRRAGNGVDWLDAAIVAAMFAFSLATLTSTLPRVSLESLLAAASIGSGAIAIRRATATEVKAVLVGVGCAGLLLSILFLGMWGMTWAEWMTRSNGVTFPPLNLRLQTAGFGHPHDVAILLMLCAPAIWLAAGDLGVPRRLRWPVLLPTIAVVVMSGSRMVGLATVIATLVVPGVSLGAVASLRRANWVVAGVIALAILGLAGIAGGATAVATRLAAFATLDARQTIWGSSLDVWADRVLLGSGPGTFAHALRSSSYFRSEVFAPGHADNAVVQALVETGVIGLCTLSALAVAFLMHRRGHVSRPALWVAIFASVVSLGSNPSAFGYGAVLIPVWISLGAPVHLPPFRVTTARRRIAGYGTIAVLGLVSGAYLAGEAFHDGARVRLESGLTQDAARALERAVAIDPGNAMYRRDRAAVALQMDDLDLAQVEIRRATQLNPWDDVGWRVRTLVDHAQGHTNRAVESATAAAALRRSDTRNLVLLAWALNEAGREIEARAALSEAVHYSPWVVADPIWQAAFGEGSGPRAVADAGLLENRATSTGLHAQAAWIGSLSGNDKLVDVAVRQAPNLRATYSGLKAALSCHPDEATQLLESVPPSQRNNAQYWFARVVVARLASEPVEDILRLSTLFDPRLAPSLTSQPVTIDRAQDESFYGVRPLSVQTLVLPTAAVGRSRWLVDPWAAWRASSETASCTD